MGRSFKELDVWKKASLLRKEITELTKKFPSEEKFRLTEQMIRASRSVTANIAEGHGRYHYQENVQFCRMSRGSLTELQDHLSVAVEENYIDLDLEHTFNQQIEECIRLLNGYINYLLKAKKQDTYSQK